MVEVVGVVVAVIVGVLVVLASCGDSGCGDRNGNSDDVSGWSG